MCIILTSAKGKLLNQEWLETSARSNPHGGGFSYCKDGKLFLEKGFFKFEDFYEAYKKVEGYSHIVHFRYRTHGETDKDNCHPFIISDAAHFAHNGVLHGYNQNPKMSDTFNFCEERLKPLTRDTQNKKWWKNTGLQWVLEGAIGSGNKISILDNTGNITIINKSAGEWVDEEETIWASNNSYKVLKTRNDPRLLYTRPQNTTYLARYESDYMNLTQSTCKSTIPLLLDQPKNKASYNGMFSIPDEELKEVDDYLDILNS